MKFAAPVWRFAAGQVPTRDGLPTFAPILRR
jgi:hypothetical protein